MESEQIREILYIREKQGLSGNASLSRNASRRKTEPLLEDDYRTSFSVDSDRILHSKAFTRYIDKTQVFYLVKNDHITHRVLHVQLVSKISRTIARALRLNEDLAEAIALGHDIGHAPFGHEGETYLSENCRKHGIGHFLHNVQSIQFLDKVERDGAGLNLCLETLDGILCHDGETHTAKLVPNKDKNFDVIEKEIDQKKENPDIRIMPMTLEGCIVRIADTISYLGRDIEDAVMLGIIKRSDIPDRCASVLSTTNGTIVYRLVTDIIRNSFEKDYIALSPEKSEALRALKEFNLKSIYLDPRIKKLSSEIKKRFSILFERYMEDLEKDNLKSPIFTQFLIDKADEYKQRHKQAEFVRDFISGMTDRYFLRQFPDKDSLEIKI